MEELFHYGIVGSISKLTNCLIEINGVSMQLIVKEMDQKQEQPKNLMTKNA